MPHAALWVVQPYEAVGTKDDFSVSMPHAAIPFRPHHRFAVPLPCSRRGGLVRLCFFAESRNISFPRRCGGSGERSKPIGAPMPHAALWVVQHTHHLQQPHRRGVSMPHAAIPFRPHHRFAVPLPRSRRGGLVTLCFFAESRNISFPRRCGGSGERSEPMGALMPHAALWVMQPRSTTTLGKGSRRFNAARGFVGGAAPFRGVERALRLGFQCRTRLCGWCSI